MGLYLQRCRYLISVFIAIVSIGCGGGGTGVVGDNNDTNISQENISADMASAKVLEVGKPYEGNFAKDYVNWVKVTVTKGTKYTIETSVSGVNTDTILYLYDTDGKTVLRHNDDSGQGKASKIVWTAPADGVYYLKILSYEESVEYSLSYTLLLSIVEPEPLYIDLKVSEFNIPNSLDEIKSFDNVIAIKNQGTVDINTPFYVGIYISSDENITIGDMLIGYYQIASLKAKEAIYSYDISLTIPKNATELISTPFSIASAITAIPSSSFIDITLGESYYVGIICDIGQVIVESDELNNASVGREVTFELPPSVSDIVLTDRYEEDDDRDSATELDSEPQYHNFYDDATDWFIFFGDVFYEYTIKTQDLGIISTTNLSIFDGLDINLAQGSSEIVFRPEYNSNYTLLAQSDSNQTGIGTDYMIAISSQKVGMADDYEDDNSYEEASRISYSNTQNHNFYDNPTDWMMFSATKDNNYTITVDMLGAGTTPTLELYESNGTTKIITFAQTVGSITTIVWQAPQSGTYYIKVASTGDQIGNDHHYRLLVLEQ